MARKPKPKGTKPTGESVNPGGFVPFFAAGKDMNSLPVFIPYGYTSPPPHGQQTYPTHGQQEFPAPVRPGKVTPARPRKKT